MDTSIPKIDAALLPANVNCFAYNSPLQRINFAIKEPGKLKDRMDSRVICCVTVLSGTIRFSIFGS